MTRNKFKNRVISGTTAFHRVADVKKSNLKIKRVKTGTTMGKIPTKVLKLPTHVIDLQITNMMNNNLSRNSFLDFAKIATTKSYLKK